jgi:MtrB/PioB family decaheme-associated outer membrane protein
MTFFAHLYRGTILGIAIAAPMAPAYAQNAADQAAPAKPESTISVGASAASGDARDRTIFGQYNGLRDDRGNLLLDLDYVGRDAGSGLWTRIYGHDLGLDSRELGISVQKQGDWRFSAGYNEIVHHEIRTINTGMLGAGSATPEIVRLATPGTGSDVDLSLKRKALTLSGDKWVSGNMQIELSFKNEDKDGSRLWARGYDCASYVCTTTQNATNTRWALLLVPEPVNFNTKQLEAKLNFKGQSLFVTAGYYGSFFTNSNGSVNPTVPNQLNGPTGALVTLDPAAAGGTSLQNVLQLPMALYPDNQAHQLYVAGNYEFMPKLRSTFKLAYTHASQDDDFLAKGLTGAPAGRSNLGGVLDTLLAQFGLTSRPMPKLSLLANLRYEKKDDKTPIAPYNIENVTIWNNSHISDRRLAGKLEGTYQLPAGTRVTLGMDYDEISRELPGLDVDVAGLSALRGKNQETTYRAELRRNLSETFTGAVSVSEGRRTGSDWYNLCTSAACATQGLVYGGLYSAAAIYQRTGAFPFNLSDRKRDKVRLHADWMPMERLSLQFAAEAAVDVYSPPSGSGLSKGGMTLLSVDAAYSVSDRWKFTAYGSVGNQTMNTADLSNYIADTTNRSTAAGFVLTGQLTGALDVGASLSYVRDVTEYALSPDGTLTSASNIAQNAVGLPDVTYSQAQFGIFAKYALDTKSNVRVDLRHIVAKLDEWSWGFNGIPFTYSDNTTVSLDPNQRSTILAARYIYKF